MSRLLAFLFTIAIFAFISSSSVAQNNVEIVSFNYSLGAEDFPDPLFNFFPWQLNYAGDIDGDGLPDFYTENLAADEITINLQDRIYKTVFYLGGDDIFKENKMLVRKRFKAFANLTGNSQVEAFILADGKVLLAESEGNQLYEKQVELNLASEQFDEIKPCVDINNDGNPDAIAYKNFVDIDTAQLHIVYGADKLEDVRIKNYANSFSGNLNEGIDFNNRYDGYICTIRNDEPKIIQLTSGKVPGYNLNHWYINEININDNDELEIVSTIQLIENYPEDRITKMLATADLDNNGSEELLFKAHSDIYLFTVDQNTGFFNGESAKEFYGYRGFSIIGDFNNDGYDDLSLLNLDSSVSIVMGDSDMSLNEAAIFNNYQYEFLENSSNKATDINGDGFDDIILNRTGEANGVDIYLGNSEDTFESTLSTEWTRYPPYNTPTHTSNIGDINNDGVEDYAILYEGTLSDSANPSLQVYFGGNDFLKKQPDVIIQHEENQRLGPPVAGDFNGDGQGDIAINSYNDHQTELHIYYGGDLFDTTSDYNLFYRDILTEVWLGSYTYNYLSNAGDINMDGADDIIFYSRSAGQTYPYIFKSYVLFGGEEISNVPDLEIETPVGVMNLISVNDINGDGKPEVIISSNNNLYFYSGFNESEGESFNNEPFLVIEKEYSTPSRIFGLFGTMMDTGDYNGDGLIDLVVSAFHHKSNVNIDDPIDAIYIYFGNENDSLSVTSFPLETEFFAGYGFDETYPFLTYHSGELTTVNDLNGDGADELMVGAGANAGFHTNAAVYYGNQNIDSIGVKPDLLLKGANQSLGLGSHFPEKHSAIGDFDSDGETDFILIQGNDFNYLKSPYYVYQPGIEPTGTNSENVQKVSNFQLFQNYPNPFNPVTTITYSLASPGIVKLEVFDITGRLISKLVEERQVAGSYSYNYNAKSLASGIYIYKLTANEATQIKKMTLIK